MIAEQRISEVTEQEEILWALEQNARRYNAWLLSRALPHIGTSVLEVGAGIGTFTLALAQRGVQVAALEPDERLADILEERTQPVQGVEVYRESIGPLTAESLGRSFDSVICFNVLEHIADDAEALDAMRCSLRRDGELMLLAPAHQLLYGETDRAVEHERRYDSRGLSRLLGYTGLEVVQLQYVNPLGAAGWLVSSRLLKRSNLDCHALRIYEHLVPALRQLDRVRFPVGLSLWARARRKL